jgi:hypothetical protein
MAYKKGSKEAMQNRQRLVPSAPFERDLNDGKEWSEDDIREGSVGARGRSAGTLSFRLPCGLGSGRG